MRLPANDLRCKKFGRLLVCAYAGTNKHNYHLWDCLCDCGSTKVCIQAELLSGRRKHCGIGCAFREKNVNFKDLSGKRFGNMVVISYAGNGTNGQAKWNCICDCGKKQITYSGQFLQGHADRCLKCALARIPQRKELTGKKFGTVTVVSFSGNKLDKRGKPRAFWNCVCDCGELSITAGSDLTEKRICCVKCRHRKTRILGLAQKRKHTYKIDFHDALEQEKLEVERIALEDLAIEPVEQKLEAIRTDVIPPWAKGK